MGKIAGMAALDPVISSSGKDGSCQTHDCVAWSGRKHGVIDSAAAAPVCKACCALELQQIVWVLRQ